MPQKWPRPVQSYDALYPSVLHPELLPRPVQPQADKPMITELESEVRKSWVLMKPWIGLRQASATPRLARRPVPNPYLRTSAAVNMANILNDKLYGQKTFETWLHNHKVAWLIIDMQSTTPVRNVFAEGLNGVFCRVVGAAGTDRTTNERIASILAYCEGSYFSDHEQDIEALIKKYARASDTRLIAFESLYDTRNEERTKYISLRSTILRLFNEHQAHKSDKATNRKTLLTGWSIAITIWHKPKDVPRTVLSFHHNMLQVMKEAIVMIALSNPDIDTNEIAKLSPDQPMSHQNSSQFHEGGGYGNVWQSIVKLYSPYTLYQHMEFIATETYGSTKSMTENTNINSRYLNEHADLDDEDIDDNSNEEDAEQLDGSKGTKRKRSRFMLNSETDTDSDTDSDTRPASDSVRCMHKMKPNELKDWADNRIQWIPINKTGDTLARILLCLDPDADSKSRTTQIKQLKQAFGTNKHAMQIIKQCSTVIDRMHEQERTRNFSRINRLDQIAQRIIQKKMSQQTNTIEKKQ